MKKHFLILLIIGALAVLIWVGKFTDMRFVSYTQYKGLVLWLTSCVLVFIYFSFFSTNPKDLSVISSKRDLVFAMIHNSLLERKANAAWKTLVLALPALLLASEVCSSSSVTQSTASDSYNWQRIIEKFAPIFASISLAIHYFNTITKRNREISEKNMDDGEALPCRADEGTLQR